MVEKFGAKGWTNECMQMQLYIAQLYIPVCSLPILLLISDRSPV